MLSDVSENENIEPMSRSNTDKQVGDSSMDSGDKTLDIINSLEVQVMKKDGKDFTDIDFENLEEGNFYRVEYQGDVYSIEKLANGNLAFYEVID
ncbi:MAG TPA: hypothetical protein VER14_01595 [Phototrophicaceae bacterium]|nr:hypothetical protein [Phototrophicaceae bacterium]